MPAATLLSTYAGLDEDSRHVLQILAISDDVLKPQDVVDISYQTGWTNRKGKQLSKTMVAQTIEALLRRKLLRKVLTVA